MSRIQQIPIASGSDLVPRSTKPLNERWQILLWQYKLPTGWILNFLHSFPYFGDLCLRLRSGKLYDDRQYTRDNMRTAFLYLFYIYIILVLIRTIQLPSNIRTASWGTGTGIFTWLFSQCKWGNAWRVRVNHYRSVYIPSFRFSFFYFIIENRKRVTKHPFPFF